MKQAYRQASRYATTFGEKDGFATAEAFMVMAGTTHRMLENIAGKIADHINTDQCNGNATDPTINSIAAILISGGYLTK